MGKTLDSRTVEYAYIFSIQVQPNIHQEGNYNHHITIQYELKDSDHKLLENRALSHIITGGTSQADVETYLAAVTAALPDLVAADKYALSGYQPS